MRAYLAVGLTVLLILGLGTYVIAADGDGDDQPTVRQGRQRGGEGRNPRPEGAQPQGEDIRPEAGQRRGDGPRGDAEMQARRLDRMVNRLGLTDEQVVRFRQVWQTHQQAVKNWEQANGEKVRSLREAAVKARQDKDKEAFAAAMEQLRPLLESRRQLQEQLWKQLGEVLTPEQLEQLKEMMDEARPMIARLMGPLRMLDLSDQQKQQIKQIIDEAREKAQQALTPQEREEMWKAAAEKIRSDVLTAEQREKLEQLRQQRQQRGPRGEGEQRGPGGGEGNGEMRGPRRGEGGGEMRGQRRGGRGAPPAESAPATE